MNKQFQDLCKELEHAIEHSYTSGTSLEDAERLAAKFLFAQMAVSEQLKNADLDSRMRKTGVKAIRAAVYLEIVRSSEKKPTETQIASTVDTDDLVLGEQKAFDTAEVIRNDLERYYNIFGNAHIYYRGIAKGNFS